MHAVELVTYQDYLKNTQYGTSDKLNARIKLHQRFGTNPVPWMRWVFDQLEITPGMTVLEVGCGPGNLWKENLDRIPAEMRVIAGDLSHGMALEALNALKLHQFPALLCLDAQAIPLIGHYFDLIIANHMLYHVPDLSKTLFDFMRVAKPGALLCAATNGGNHMRELIDAVCLFWPEYRHVWQQFHRFSLENALSTLRDFTKNLSIVIYEDELNVTDSTMLVAYVESLLGFTQIQTKENIDALMDYFHEYMMKEGVFRIQKSVGLVLGRFE